MAIHIAWGDDAYTTESLILAGLIACAVATALAFAPARILPAAPILLVYYWVAIVRPTFSPPRLTGAKGRMLLSSDSYELALLGALLFVVVVMISSRLAQPWGHRVGIKVARLLDPPEPYTGGHTLVARCAAATGLALFVFVNLKPTLIPLAISFATYLFASPAIPLGLLYWDAYKTKKPLARTLFWLVVAFTAVLGFSSGSLGPGVVPVLIAAALIWTTTGRIPIALIFVGLTVFMILNPAKNRFRALTWYQDRDVGIEERIEAWMYALAYTYSTETDTAIDDSLESTARRTSSLPSVALVFDTVPGAIPFAGPGRWFDLPKMFVPRVFWPEKPSHTIIFNNEFTLTFGLQTRTGVETTTLNLPSVGDGYWRLGWPGVIIEGLLLGLVIGLFQGATLTESRALLILGIGFVVSSQADKHVFFILASLPQYLFASGTILYAARVLTTWFVGDPSPATTVQPRTQPTS